MGIYLTDREKINNKFNTMQNCHLCEKNKLMPLLKLGKHPIAHHLLTSSSQDEYVHDVNVVFCENCGLIQLTDTIPSDKLYSDYHSLSSWKWNPHIPRLIGLIENLPNLNKTSRILEVGCNDGSFLKVLSEKGYKNLLGIEPARDAQSAARQKGFNVIGSYFNKKTAEEYVASYGNCDILVVRQVLEHITNLKDFGESMQIVLKEGAYVLIEVPDFELSLNAPDYSAIWEEHTNYFTSETLARFLEGICIHLIVCETAIFSGRILIALGKYTRKGYLSKSNGYFNKLRTKAFNYSRNWPIFCKKFINYLSEQKNKMAKIAVYGAGNRACSLINFTQAGHYIDFIFDDQPEKQGKYMPGSRIPILPGNKLDKSGVKLCLLAVNAENEEKVIKSHQQYQKNGGIFASMHPPSKMLLSIWKELK